MLNKKKDDMNPCHFCIYRDALKVLTLLCGISPGFKCYFLKNQINNIAFYFLVAKRDFFFFNVFVCVLNYEWVMKCIKYS